ncbi:MAG: ABC transporter permease [Candidatus Pacebacteria bacterium]|nr:ABC transporter permease [Candidatus Paceibacterota bacterium]
MNSKHILTIWKKELRDTVRDRRTLVSMILVPMLLMPVIMLGMFKFMSEQAAKQQTQIAKISIVGGDYAPQLAEAIKSREGVEIAEVDVQNYKQSVAEGRIDAAVVIPEDFQDRIAGEKAVNLELVSKSTNANAANAFAAVSFVVADFNAGLLEGRFTARDINADILSGVTIVPEDLATEQEVGGFVLAMLLPLLIVMWSIVGGQYTAIDVSAGEKERKTLEALLLTPVKRIDVVFGKFLAVSTVAIISVVTAIGSLYFSFSYAGDLGIPMEEGNGLSMGGAGGSGLGFSIEPQVALLLFIVSLFLVLMFSAVILSISIYAKSFKEAQSYIGPAYIVVILPVALVNSVPGFEPVFWMFALPAVNAVLLFKELFMGAYDWGHISLTLFSLIIYSIIAILIAAKTYSKESVLFGD